MCACHYHTLKHVAGKTQNVFGSKSVLVTINEVNVMQKNIPQKIPLFDVV